LLEINRQPTLFFIHIVTVIKLRPRAEGTRGKTLASAEGFFLPQLFRLNQLCPVLQEKRKKAGARIIVFKTTTLVLQTFEFLRSTFVG